MDEKAQSEGDGHKGRLLREGRLADQEADRQTEGGSIDKTETGRDGVPQDKKDKNIYLRKAYDIFPCFSKVTS